MGSTLAIAVGNLRGHQSSLRSDGAETWMEDWEQALVVQSISPAQAAAAAALLGALRRWRRLVVKILWLIRARASWSAAGRALQRFAGRLQAPGRRR